MSGTEGVPANGGQGAATETTTTTAAATITDTTTASPPPPPPPDPFYKSLKNPELRGYAEVKGFKGNDGVEFSETILESYRNLEKLRGVPAERLLTLPENLEDAEAMAPIREKLGLAPPKEASEYSFATMENANPERARALEALALKHGVPKSMASALFADVLAADLAQMQATEAQYAEEVAVERGKLQAEIGANKWDEFLENGRRTARRFGLDDTAIANLENSIGYEKTMRFMDAVGKTTGEAAFVDGGSGQAHFAVTPEAARTRIDALRNDEGWRQKFAAGDVNAKAEWSRLHKIAYPGEVQQ